MRTRRLAWLLIVAMLTMLLAVPAYAEDDVAQYADPQLAGAVDTVFRTLVAPSAMLPETFGFTEATDPEGTDVSGTVEATGPLAFSNPAAATQLDYDGFMTSASGMWKSVDEDNIDVWANGNFDPDGSAYAGPVMEWSGWKHNPTTAGSHQMRGFRATAPKQETHPGQRYAAFSIVPVYNATADGYTYHINDSLYAFINKAPVFAVSTTPQEGVVTASRNADAANPWDGWSATIPASAARLALPDKEVSNYTIVAITDEFAGYGALGKLEVAGEREYRLNVDVQGKGEIRVRNLTADTAAVQVNELEEWYAEGTRLNLTAVSTDPDFTFVGWEQVGERALPEDSDSDAFEPADRVTLIPDERVGVKLNGPVELRAVFQRTSISFRKFVLDMQAYDRLMTEEEPDSNDRSESEMAPPAGQTAIRWAKDGEFSFTLEKLAEGMKDKPTDEKQAAASSESTPALLSFPTSTVGLVRIPIDGPGLYLLREVGADAARSDIPDGLLLLVSSNGTVKEFDRPTVEILKIIENAGIKALGKLKLRPFNRTVTNRLLPQGCVTKTVGLTEDPTTTTLSTITGTTVHYLVTVKNPFQNNPLFFYTSDRFGDETTILRPEGTSDEDDLIFGIEGINSPEKPKPPVKKEIIPIQVLGPGDTIQYRYTRDMNTAGVFVNTATVHVVPRNEIPQVSEEGFSSDSAALSDMESDIDDGDSLDDKQTVKFITHFLKTRCRDTYMQEMEFGSASATVTVTAPSSNPPVRTVTVANNILTIAQEGQGTILPGAGSAAYSSGSIVQMNAPVPAAGWTFAGWFGANGTEVVDNKIQMTGDKSIVARFVQETVVTPASEIPQAAPEVTPAPTPAATEVTGAEVIETPVVVPQAAPALPKTGGVPYGLVMLLGGLLAASGLSLKKRK